jgi:DNA polymerase-3 subunit epsilon
MTIEFAVIDFETTGFSPSKNRVIEIGVVRTDSSGRVLGEYQTLIQPNQDVGRTDIHGISATDLVDAPIFGEVLNDLAKILNGAILVAHNAKFDFSFLEHELDRAQAAFLDIDGLCTLELVYQVMPSGSRKLSHCCEHFGIPLGNLHSALDDARMAAQLLSKLLESTDIHGLPEPFEMRPANGPAKAPLHRSPISVNNPKIDRAITRHSNQMPAKPAKGQVSTATVSQYLNLLDAVMQDEFLDEEEVKALEELATLLKLDLNAMALLNSAHIHNLCRTAMSDQIVTEDERRHIRTVAELLQVTDWEQILDGPQKPSEPTNVGEGSSLAGLRVCFTGTMNLSREECHNQAKRHGLLVQDNVTKKLDILVVADQNSESSKARKAREYSVRIINEAAFFDLLSS